jgi:predicted N-acyltransferase
LVGVPFTPATGTRILIDPRIIKNSTPQTITELRRLIGDFLRQIAVSNNLSSVNINFMTDEEATSLSKELKYPKVTVQIENEGFKEKLKGNSNEYLRRTSIQYHWLNQNPKKNNEPFQSFDDYLECFKSKRRITIRRERRRVLYDERIRIDAIIGTDILKHDGLIERMFAIYKATVDKMYYGRQYLTLDFFKMLSKSSFCNNLCFICARNASTCSTTFRAEDVFAGTFNIVKDGVFYGRYWGVLPGHEINSLHFEVCYWSAIEYCIKNGLKRMEPGAGGGEYKWARGFDPAMIHSVHFITHPALRAAIQQFLDFETESLVDSTEYLLEKSVTGSKNLSK